jgi:hypothetical protein
MFSDITIFDVLEKSIERRRVNDWRDQKEAKYKERRRCYNRVEEEAGNIVQSFKTVSRHSKLFLIRKGMSQ